MLAEIDVFVGNNTLVDLEVFQLWLEGYSAQDAANVLHQKEGMKDAGIPLELLKSDILDHYRTLTMLERLLHSPMHLAEQWTFQVTPEIQRILIKKYYDFDCSVIREFLGKKLSSRNRKDLDEVSEKTGVDIKSCRRQFDNVKRVYKVVEEISGSIVHKIQSHFLLPEDLAKKYAAIVYITNNRFETGKKKLHYLTFDDFYHCANQMIIHWSCNNAECKYEETAMEMDREFLQNLRDMKLLLDKDVMDEHKCIVVNELKGRVSDRVHQDIDSNFKSLSRTLVNIAYGLNHSKELKDFFIDLVEKVTEPCRSSRWSHADLQHFLEAYTEASHYSSAFKSEPHLLEVWKRYMRTLSSCVCKMYHG